MYPNDLESDLVQECLHFQCHLSSERISINPDSGSLQSLSLFLRKQNLEPIYLNLELRSTWLCAHRRQIVQVREAFLA